MEILNMLRVVVCLVSSCQAASVATENGTTVAPDSLGPTGSSWRTQPPLNVSLASADETDVRRNIIEASGRAKRANADTIVVEQRDITRGAQPIVQHEDGSLCKFNEDCVSECCALVTENERVCSPLATKGQRCETGQAKGGFYPYFCPCVAGDAACTGGAKDALTCS